MNISSCNSRKNIEIRPLFKGLSHLLAFIFYLANFRFLVDNTPTKIQFPIMTYLITLLGHFACSAFLHMINWSDDWVIYPRRLDHVIIFFKILATYYVAISTVMMDMNPLVLQVVIIGTLFGIINRLMFTDAPSWVIALPYFINGWAILLDPKAILSLIQRLPLGSLLCLLSGIMYSIGGYIYIKKSPTLSPKYFGYHELFHIFSILGTSGFVLFTFKYAIPWYIKYHNVL